MPKTALMLHTLEHNCQRQVAKRKRKWMKDRWLMKISSFLIFDWRLIFFLVNVLLVKGKKTIHQSCRLCPCLYVLNFKVGISYLHIWYWKQYEGFDRIYIFVFTPHRLLSIDADQTNYLEKQEKKTENTLPSG